MAIGLHGFAAVLCLLFVATHALKLCTKDSITNQTLSCDRKHQKTKIVFYYNEDCDMKHADSVSLPRVIENVPCFCDPGSGKENRDAKGCEECPAGYFSHGGEYIDDWSQWNNTGVLGHLYDADSYCSDFLTGKPCNPWRPSGDNTFLISGDFKNSTQLRCFEQSMLVMKRDFVRTKEHNKITFEYKVDGAGCRRGNSVCSNGLYVYVNERKMLKKDVQFRWTKFEIPNLIQGINKIKFVYHKSCTREKLLDVAYIKNIAFIGTEAAELPCFKCKAGTFAKNERSIDCEKCPPNTYQDEEGKTSCKKCKENEFSRQGSSECIALPQCKMSDYYVHPDEIRKCYKEGDAYYRKQAVVIPTWFGGKAACQDNPSVKPAGDPIPCSCPPGWELEEVGKNKVSCEHCPTGSYATGKHVDGKPSGCLKCDDGYAAIPGYFIDIFDGEGVDSRLKQNCTGSPDCPDDKNVWMPRGDFLATRRIAGNHEMTLKFDGIEFDYHEASISFNCSVDCRMDMKDSRLAKHDHCFMKFVMKRLNTTSNMYEAIREVDCVNKYRPYLRNGTIQQHTYRINEPGNYSFTALFHQEDEANFSMVSYEARIYNVDIRGSASGSARECTICRKGTYLSEDKRFCRKCPNGKYSGEGASECIKCPLNTFAREEGSPECTPCGEGTTSNKNGDGCDYNGCTFTPQEGITYDLSPLRRDGGPMYKVQTYKSKLKYRFMKNYFINICSWNHDNSSCTQVERSSVTSLYNRIYKQKTVLLKTMACMRWPFDIRNSQSIGEVLSFKAKKENVSGGLIIELKGGYKSCWDKGRLKLPVTTIHMECDMNAGIGNPEQMGNHTDVKITDCEFEIKWRTRYACPMCIEKDKIKTYGDCINGKRFVTLTQSSSCRTTSYRSTIINYQETCKETGKLNEKLTKTNPSSPKYSLIVAVVIAVLIIIVLFAIVVYYIKRNRALRGRLFSPGKTFSKVKEEDEDELVDNMMT